MKELVYPSGLYFSETLALNVKMAYDRVLLENKASMIIIDGGVGEGKTTLAKEICDFLNGSPVILKDVMGMGGVDFMVKMKNVYKAGGHLVIYDEAGDFDRRGAITKFNMFMNRVFDIYRAFKILPIVTLPCMNVFDGAIFDKKIPRLLIHTYNRNAEYGNFKAWSLYRMLYVRHWMNKLIVKEKAYEIVSPNFHGHFKNLPPEMAKELSDFTIGGKFGVLEEAEIRQRGLLSIEEVAQKVGRSYVWTQRTIRGLGILPVKVYRNKKYFENYVLDRLLSIVGVQK